jgi:hypothetical protein
MKGRRRRGEMRRGRGWQMTDSRPQFIIIPSRPPFLLSSLSKWMFAQ